MLSASQGDQLVSSLIYRRGGYLKANGKTMAGDFQHIAILKLGPGHGFTVNPGAIGAIQVLQKDSLPGQKNLAMPFGYIGHPQNDVAFRGAANDGGLAGNADPF